MPITAGGLQGSEVLAECRSVYLNDSSAQIYGDAVLFPHLKAAYQNLEDKLVDVGISYVQEEATDKIIAAGIKVFDPLPADFIEPVWLGERTPGTTDEFKPMYETRWAPNYTPDLHLIFWVWEEGAIKFAGATAAREVRMRYIKALSSLSSYTTVIIVPNSKSYLSQKTSALAAQFIGRNTELAADLEARATSSLDLLIGSLVKNKQGKGVRARPFRSFREKR